MKKPRHFLFAALTLSIGVGVFATPKPLPSSERVQSSERLLRAVDSAWQAAPVTVGPVAVSVSPPVSEVRSPLEAKLDRIVLPEVAFNGLELSRVLVTLAAAAMEMDTDAADATRGVNLVLADTVGANPRVELTLRGLTLRRVLELVASSVGYRCEVGPDAVIFRPAEPVDALQTRVYPVTRPTVARLMGRSESDRARTSAPTAAASDEGRAMREFLQLAGVDFNGTPGSTLAFDGSRLIVTHVGRELERVGNILARYREERQVEIEAKFMEVQEGALEELGVQWRASTKASQRNAGAQAVYQTDGGGTRPLNEAFSFQGQSRSLDIASPGGVPGNLSLPVAPPTMPGGVSLGAAEANLATVTGVLGEFDVTAVVRALQQRSGTELLSAPRLTVLSGSAATITVAQEMRYPQSYGQIQSQVGTGSVSGGGSAGVSITSGTPQDFTTRNVGVELRVSPTVEEDNRSISLELNPKVTEFEGFVEYGGPSVAISGGTTVTVPPGFYQPIFAVREVRTRVTIWDGATLVMGGLTREEVKKVKDKVPVLGSLPLLGRLFRSEGESTQKRNLLIFVTARLVNPGGGPLAGQPGAGAAETVARQP